MPIRCRESCYGINCAGEITGTSFHKRIAMALDVNVGVNNLEEAAKLYTHFQNREVSYLGVKFQAWCASNGSCLFYSFLS